MIWQTLKWAIRVVLFAIILGGMWGCTMLGLNYASLDTENNRSRARISHCLLMQRAPAQRWKLSFMGLGQLIFRSWPVRLG